MVNNNIKELQKQLNNELIKNWKETSEEVKKEVAISSATADIYEKNVKLTLKIKELKQEKDELKKTLLAELAGGVHDTYQNLIAEKEQEIKKLEERQNESNYFIVSIADEQTKLKEELKEKEIFIEELKTKLQETELKEQTHIEAFEVSERWNKNQKAELIKEYNDCVDLLYEADDIIEDRDDTIRDLRKDLKERQELLDERDEQNEELRRQLDLERKPLPSLPKKQNKFQQLGTKIKTKFQNIVKKVKHQERELVARIEVNPK